MLFARWNAWLKRRFSSSFEARAALPRRRTVPLLLERLETRDCPSIFFVTNNTDSGSGSLRAAITGANADHDVNGATILFNIGANGSPQTIALLSDLPALSNPNGIDIEGPSQGSNNTSLTVPLITLTPAGGSTATNGLLATAGNNRIEGLNIQNFSNDGLLLLSNGNLVTFDQITGNHNAGVVLSNAAFNTIGSSSNDSDSSFAGNVISGNLGNGLVLAGSGTFDNSVERNFIGTDAAGTAANANLGVGVAIAGGAHGNSIGNHLVGSGAANVISGNNGSGIAMIDAGTIDNVVAGNRIGSNFTGTSAIANGDDGVRIAGGASANTIDIQVVSGQQVISGNTHFGVEIDMAGTSHNLVDGNRIGVGSTGSALPNGLGGVFIDGATNNTIGSSVVPVAASNVISGNNGIGRGAVWLIDNASGNIVLGNYIGTNTSGTAALANQADGVLLSLGANHNTIGGCTTGSGNIISGNGSSGVGLDSASFNVIAGNRIGTDDAGNAAVANQGTGVVIGDNSTANTVGGTATGCGNLISGNRDSGIGIDHSSANIVVDNLIGISASFGPLANGFAGVALLNNATNNQIGGGNVGITKLSQFNIIAANRIGILIGTPGVANDGVNNNLVKGNFIFNNTKAGIFITANASNNLIGGSNAIDGNGGGAGGVGGVYVDSGTGNRITQNSIADNTSSLSTTNPGIGLNGANHANNDQPAPVLSTAFTTSTTSSGTVTFTGSLTVSPSMAQDRVYTIEFFSDDAKDANNFCQGETFLGSETVTIDAGQTTATFSSPSFNVPSGENFFTATATDAANDTSTFSNCVMGTTGP